MMGTNLAQGEQREEQEMANRAVVVDPSVMGRLTIREVDDPEPTAQQAIVRVAAISLNRGEVNAAMSRPAGTRPGWDLAGVIERAAADGSGPTVGARVVGFVPTGNYERHTTAPNGAWAERVAVGTDALATLPDTVSFAQAATLPVAGMTALIATEHGGALLGRKVLVGGASGGAGNFAVQLARLAGAHVTGIVRQEAHVAEVREAGAQTVVVTDDGKAAAQYGPYDLIIDSVGGALLGNLLAQIAKDGSVVTFGSSAGAEVTFDLRPFFLGGASLYGLILFHEVRRHPANIALARLAGLVADGQLKPQIGVEAPWEEIAMVARDLLDRRFTGKAVLHLD